MSDLTRAQEVEYQDFEIEVSECRCGYLEVRVLNSPFYRPRAPFKAPYSPQQFQKLMERLAAKPGLEGPQPFSNPEAKAKEIGAELFEALFPDEIAANLRESNAVLAGVSHGGYRAGLRLRIAFHNVSDHPEIFGLPWELLYDPKKKEFLALGGRVLVVRYQDAPRAALKAREGRALRVLSMTPRAKEDEHTFDREEAQSLLDKAVRLEPFVQVRRLREPTLNGLRRKLLQDPCEVLHIFGHGAFRESDATGYLVFENEDGSRDYVSGQQLADHLQDIRELRLVVLVACKGGRLPRKNGQDPYSGVATALVQAGLPAAVAMQQNISVSAALDFTSSFYGALSMGMPVDAAMGEARLAMGRGKGRPLEWATPLLTQRTPDGRIVSLASDSEEQRYQFNIVSFDDHGRERFDKYGAALLRLDEFFDGRPIRAPELWTEEILPGLKGWLRKGILPEQKSRINFAAHLTIVLATGRLLDVKSRRDVIVQQYDVDWDAEKGNPLPSPVWERNLPIEVVDENKTDLAVAVSLSRSILPGVQEYVSRGEGPAAQIGSILDATPTTGVGPTSVRDGVHASQLAQELINRLDEELANRPGTTIHLFLSAPQAFTFFFGMRTRSIPRLQMYEHHFGQGSSTYVPSVLFQGDGAY